MFSDMTSNHMRVSLDTLVPGTGEHIRLDVSVDGFLKRRADAIPTGRNQRDLAEKLQEIRWQRQGSGAIPLIREDEEIEVVAVVIRHMVIRYDERDRCLTCIESSSKRYER
jgi:hypothetical protein